MASSVEKEAKSAQEKKDGAGKDGRSDKKVDEIVRL